jgi:hypothetical protein
MLHPPQASNAILSGHTSRLALRRADRYCETLAEWSTPRQTQTGSLLRSPHPFLTSAGTAVDTSGLQLQSAIETYPRKPTGGVYWRRVRHAQPAPTSRHRPRPKASCNSARRPMIHFNEHNGAYQTPRKRISSLCCAKEARQETALCQTL